MKKQYLNLINCSILAIIFLTTTEKLIYYIYFWLISAIFANKFVDWS